MTEVLLATSVDWPEGEPSGELLVKAFADRGLAASWARWDDPAVDWSSARVVAVRSVWDYDRRRDELLGWAEHVARWSRLVNGPAVFRWNTDKSYLLDLERIGVPVVPTALLDDRAQLAEVSGRFGGRVVVKPRVAAGGRGLSVQDAGPDLGGLAVEMGVDLVEDQWGPWLVQPLVESVRSEGETSVFVFAGVPVSQALKLPAGDEIRVHEMYGGTTQAVEPTDEAMLLAAETVAAARQLFDEDLCYARVDLMRLEDGRLVVGELEVTEPGLYLDVLPGNADAFADVVATLVQDQVTVLLDAVEPEVEAGTDPQA
ncbi:MAG: Glutathione synthetase [uncultured Nocardioidaceae bacterium]|uniref:Glutathione synthetase n=1 Tax=uncultured Nocardioidaceae bacterium TaxID=253824 RepID=A0A6J4MJG5_9ACTN|nr:MAG: Glutathione synthetase [uncultured Nocardioidaceae bacterium]